MVITYTKEVTVEVDAMTFEEACEKILAMEENLEFSIAFFPAGESDNV